MTTPADPPGEVFVIVDCDMHLRTAEPTEGVAFLIAEEWNKDGWFTPYRVFRYVLAEEIKGDYILDKPMK